MIEGTSARPAALAAGGGVLAGVGGDLPTKTKRGLLLPLGEGSEGPHPGIFLALLPYNWGTLHYFLPKSGTVSLRVGAPYPSWGAMAHLPPSGSAPVVPQLNVFYYNT